MKTTRILAMLIGVLLVAIIEVSAADLRIAAYSVYKVGARLDGGGALLGSAVLLAAGKLVTSCHTTKEATRIVILHREGEIPARGAQTNLRQDPCLLLVPELRGPTPELTARREETVQIADGGGADILI